MVMALRIARSWSAWAGVTAFVVTGAASATVALEGCTVSTNDRADDAGPFEASTTDAAPSACGACVALDCAGPSAVCLTDEGCQQLLACANPFSESKGARDGCFCAGSAPTDGGVGVDPLAAYVAFAACNDSRSCSTCASDCAALCSGGPPQTRPACAGEDAGAEDSDGGDADGGDAVAPPSVDGCVQCVAGRCDSAKKLCALGSECAAFLACARGCSDAACVAACGAAHATGKSSAEELSSCTLTSCRSACGL